MAAGQHDYQRATSLFEEVLQLSRELGDTWSQDIALTGLGRLVLEQDNFAQAVPLLEETLAIGRARGSRMAVA